MRTCWCSMQVPPIRWPTSCSVSHEPGQPVRCVGGWWSGPAAPELECQLIGVGGRGTPRELDIELPPAWLVDRVRWSGSDESIVWHPTTQADGSIRLHVILPGGEAFTEGQALEIVGNLRRRGRTRAARLAAGPSRRPGRSRRDLGGHGRWNDDVDASHGARTGLDRSHSSSGRTRTQVCRQTRLSLRSGLALE